MTKAHSDLVSAFRRAEFDYAKEDILYFVKHYCFFEDKDSRFELRKLSGYGRSSNTGSDNDYVVGIIHFI